jgi:hypothetical protein
MVCRDREDGHSSGIAENPNPVTFTPVSRSAHRALLRYSVISARKVGRLLLWLGHVPSFPRVCALNAEPGAPEWGRTAESGGGTHPRNLWSDAHIEHTSGRNLPPKMRVTVQFCTSWRRTNPYTQVMVGPNLHCPVCRGIDIFRDAYPEPVTGTTVTLFYYCGRCTHSWQVVAPDARQPALVTLRPMKDRRKSA